MERGKVSCSDTWIKYKITDNLLLFKIKGYFIGDGAGVGKCDSYIISIIDDGVFLQEKEGS